MIKYEASKRMKAIIGINGASAQETATEKTIDIVY